MHKNKIFECTLFLVLVYSLLALFWPLHGFLSPIGVVVEIIFAIVTIYFVNVSKKNRNLKTLVFLLLLYSLFLLMLTTPSVRTFIELVKSKYILYPYLCIVFSIIQYDEQSIITIKKISIISIVCYVFLIFYFKDYLIARYDHTYIENTISFDEMVKDFCYTSGFLLLITPCLRKRYAFIIFIIYALTTFVAMLLARRNIIVTSCLFLIGAIVTHMSFYKNNGKYKFLIIGILLLAGCVLWPELKAIFKGESTLEMFSMLNARLMSDSRSDVLLEFRKSMSPLNWFFGKGFAAVYFSFELGARTVIETGYLNIIFRVGIISLVIYTLILIKSIRVTTPNIIILASKIYIIISMIETLYAGVPTFNIRWIIIWVSVSYCFNPKIKSLSNQQIRQLLCA